MVDIVHDIDVNHIFHTDLIIKFSRYTFSTNHQIGEDIFKQICDTLAFVSDL